MNSVAFSPDGTRVVSASGQFNRDNTVRIWDVAEWQGGRCTRPWPFPILIWSDSGRGQECTLRGHSAAVNSVAFSPDGTRVVSASGNQQSDNTVRIWDVASGKEVGAQRPWPCPILIWSDSGRGQECTLTGHSDYVRSVAYSPDGKH